MGLSKPIKNLNKLRDQEPTKDKLVSKIKKEKDDDAKSDEDSDVIMIEDEKEMSAKKAAKVIDNEILQILIWVFFPSIIAGLISYLNVIY